MKRLALSAKALADLEDIAAFIASDNPERARTFVAELRNKMGNIAEHPETYRLREEWSPGLRSAHFGRYLILFRDYPDRVRITRVLHSARDIRGLFGSKRGRQ